MKSKMARMDHSSNSYNEYMRFGVPCRDKKRHFVWPSDSGILLLQTTQCLNRPRVAMNGKIKKNWCVCVCSGPEAKALGKKTLKNSSYY